MDTRRFFAPHTWDGKIDFTDFGVDADADSRGCADCGGLFVVGRESALIEDHHDRLIRDFAGGEYKCKGRSTYMCAWCVDRKSYDPNEPESGARGIEYGRC